VRLAWLHRGIRRLSDCQCDVVAYPKTAEGVMATYRVELSQTVVETAVLWIEANDQQEAKDLALERVEAEADIEWRFAEAWGDIEIIDIREVQTTELKP
jgi:hypothetical protein